MKKQGRRIWQIVVLGLLGILMVFSLMVPQEFLLKSEPKRVEISILIRQTDNTCCAVARQGMEKAAEDLGAELRFLTLSTPNDSREQIELLRREAEMDVDGAVVVPADCKELEECLKGWNAFPVVTMESQVNGALACITPDNQQVGTLLAQQVVKDLDSKTKVLLLGSCEKCTGVNQRMEAAQRVLEQAGFAVETCTEELSVFPEAAAVLCLDSQSLLQVLEMAGQAKNRPRIYGAGASDAAVAQLETGGISALAAWSEYAQGYLAVTQAVCAARKEKMQTSVLPVTVVREGETYEPEYQKLLYPVYY